MSYQVTSRVSANVKAAFDAYANDLGLDGSALAKLLIRRERRHRQLAALVMVGGTLDQAPQSSRRSDLPTITAHYSSRTPVAEFDAYAAGCGLTRGRAGAWVFARELQERWLEKALLRAPGSAQP